MNGSRSTYNLNNSRFSSSIKDPLEIYKENKKLKFKEMYDNIEE